MNKSIKFISFCLCMTFLFSIVCTSCGQRNHVVSVASCAVDLKDLFTSVKNASGALPEMCSFSTLDKDAEDCFRCLCDFDYSKVEDYYISYSSSGTAEEIFLIKLKNSEDSTYAKLSLHNRIKSRSATFDQYQPGECSKLGKAIIASKGNYVALLICPDGYSAKQAFESYLSTK